MPRLKHRQNCKQNLALLARAFGFFINPQIYSYCQNNLPFHPPDNFVEICKNSQTKARNREHVHDF